MSLFEFYPVKSIKKPTFPGQHRLIPTDCPQSPPCLSQLNVHLTARRPPSPSSREFSGGAGVGAAASWFPPTTQETLLGEALGWIEHIWHHNINPCVLSNMNTCPKLNWKRSVLVFYSWSCVLPKQTQTWFYDISHDFKSESCKAKHFCMVEKKNGLLPINNIPKEIDTVSR